MKDKAVSRKTARLGWVVVAPPDEVERWLRNATRVVAGGNEGTVIDKKEISVEGCSDAWRATWSVVCCLLLVWSFTSTKK